MIFNRIILGDCLDIMKTFDNDLIDLTVTSPPYDNLRDYKGYSFEFQGIAEELYRITKPGGVVVWIVGDATIQGSETGTSFRQALYFKDVCGFNLHDTMIWHKGCFTAVGSLKFRYAPVFEYMFILSKGFPQTFNPLKDRFNKNVNKAITGTIRLSSGNFKAMSSEQNKKNINVYGQRFNVWEQSAGFNKSSKDKAAFKHPAIFPEKLAQDHILSWSNPGDLVFDPFMGSGTTAKMASLNDRNYLGCEISQEYIDIAESRLMPLPLFRDRIPSDPH